MKRLLCAVLLVLAAGVAWCGYDRHGQSLEAWKGSWQGWTAAGLLLVVVTLALRGGSGRRPQRSPELARTKFRLELPSGPTPLGEKLAVKCHVAVPRSLRLSHVDFALVNRRYEKKAPLDRVVSQSIFRYRFQLAQGLEKDVERTFDLALRTLTCREPTRESKYVSITWELRPTLHFSEPDLDGKASYVYEGPAVPVEFSSLQGF